MGLWETKKMCIKQHGSSPGSKTGLSTARELLLLHVVCHFPFRSQQDYFKKSLVNVNYILSVSVRIKSKGNPSTGKIKDYLKFLNPGEKKNLHLEYMKVCTVGEVFKSKIYHNLKLIHAQLWSLLNIL